MSDWARMMGSLRRIEAGVSPGGLVFCVLDATGRELERAPVTPDKLRAAASVAEAQAQRCTDDPTLWVVAYDGDTGRPIMVVTP